MTAIIEFLESLDIRHSDGRKMTYKGKSYPVPYQSVCIDGVLIPGLREVASRAALIARYTGDVYGGSYLDIGCNLGALTVAIGKRFEWVCGIDKDEHYINICTKIHDRQDIDWRCVAAEDVDARYPYNLITAMSVIENVRDTDALMSKVYTMLQPGGAFVIEGHSADIAKNRVEQSGICLRKQPWMVTLLPERTDPGLNSPYKDGRPVWVCRKE